MLTKFVTVVPYLPRSKPSFELYRWVTVLTQGVLQGKDLGTHAVFKD